MGRLGRLRQRRSLVSALGLQSGRERLELSLGRTLSPLSARLSRSEDAGIETSMKRPSTNRREKACACAHACLRLLFFLVLLNTTPVQCARADAQVGFPGFEVDGYASDRTMRGADRLEVHFHDDADWPHFVLRPRAPLNQTQVPTTLVVPVENTGASSVDLFVRVGDDPKATWPDHAIAVRTLLTPHTSTILVIALFALDPHQMGMQDPPPPIGVAPRGATFLANPSGQVDAARLASIYFVVWGRTGTRTLIVGPPVLSAADWGTDAYRGLIDRYGQFTRASWPGKVTSDEDLEIARAAEHSLAKPPASEAPSPYDEFGGWLDGPKFEATGFFRVAKDKRGIWWFASPAGHAFYSIGVDTIQLGDGRTFVEDREFMFEESNLGGLKDDEITGTSPAFPPGTANRMPRFNQGRWINFFAANLRRKYGENFASIATDIAIERLPRWGFNTIGNWSSPTLWERHKLPYVVPVTLGHGTVAIPGDGTNASFPDPFDAGFPSAVESALATAALSRKTDPWLIGYFVDNELSFGYGQSENPRERFSLALRVLASGAHSPSKSAFIAGLRKRYERIEAFRSAWGVSLPSWEALADGPPLLPDRLTPECISDLDSFSDRLADTYYRIVAETLRRFDPSHLYLGSRFAAQTDSALKACNRWCDVVSFNIYASDLVRAREDRFRGITKPVVIGEFNFSSPDRGPFGRGVVDVGSEEARAGSYAAYMTAAAQDPNIIGAHWFQYHDEPASGRLLDGENSHFGLVSITDTPYFDFLATVLRTNQAVLSLRMKAASQHEGH